MIKNYNENSIASLLLSNFVNTLGLLGCAGIGMYMVVVLIVGKWNPIGWK